MEIKSPDFILEAPNFFSESECLEYIDYYKNMESSGFTVNRIQSMNKQSHEISDEQLFFNNSTILKISCGGLTQKFLNKFWEIIYPIYAQKFSIIKGSASHKIYNIKIQKTNPGEGYHTWHFETDSKVLSDRLLFFILYLNTVESGGETEFLYYKKRVTAETGKLLLCPASFTHTHRGNPPLSGEKYILTGWVEYD